MQLIVLLLLLLILLIHHCQFLLAFYSQLLHQIMVLVRLLEFHLIIC